MIPLDTIPEGAAILVSACLLGIPCRYDGLSQPCSALVELGQRYRLVPVCPEQLGGLPTPRIPSEIQPNAHVVDANGIDRTAAFLAGACASVETALAQGCTLAVLKSRSPSCGVRRVYDGTFTGTLVDGQGVTTAALRAAGVRVFDEEEL